MVYLKSIELLNEINEHNLICGQRNIHNNTYPLRIFPPKELTHIDFAPITCFYGGNGSGKTTLLNIIASSLNASKRNISLKGEIFDDYVKCVKRSIETAHTSECKEIKFIMSDDVFDYLLDTRAINSRVNRRKDDLANEYVKNKYTESKDLNIAFEEYDLLKDRYDSMKMTSSKYIRSRLRNNTIIEASNGETALDFWQNEMRDNALYIIDEPENSLSAENQIKLKDFIEESSRFYNCQFIIATHSPFLLSLTDALIYDLDCTPARIKKWTELENVRVYYNFFKENENKFNK